MTKLASKAKENDNTFLFYLTKLTGTHWQEKKDRILHLSMVLLCLTFMAAVLPWFYCLIAVLLGILTIFITFRHWAKDEDETQDNVHQQYKFIPINGDLNAEILIALSFFFVFVPIAFSQMQMNGFGFEMDPRPGPFAFISYTLIETLKAGSIVDYYDIFATDIEFDKLSGVKEPTFSAKIAIMTYRVSLNIFILASIKRLIDIAKRRTDGHDVRPLEDSLRKADITASKQHHRKVIDQLKLFALRGRGNARDLLEKVVTSNKFNLDASIKSLAAKALFEYADKRVVTGPLYSASAVFENLLNSEWTREKDPQNWARTQLDLALVYERLGTGSGKKDLIEKAVQAYKNALEVVNPREHLKLWLSIMNSLGDALYELGELEGGEPEYFESAIKVYQEEFKVIDRQNNPKEWGEIQKDMGRTYRMLYNVQGDIEHCKQAINAYKNALSIVTLENQPSIYLQIKKSLAELELDLEKNS